MESIHGAARSGDIMRVKALLWAYHTDANTKDCGGNTALHFAVQGGHLKIVELLLANGADVCAENRECDTALHFAVNKNNIKIAKVLLAYGAPLRVKNDKLVSPMRAATGAMLDLLFP